MYAYVSVILRRYPRTEHRPCRPECLQCHTCGPPASSVVQPSAKSLHHRATEQGPLGAGAAATTPRCHKQSPENKVPYVGLGGGKWATSSTLPSTASSRRASHVVVLIFERTGVVDWMMMFSGEKREIVCAGLASLARSLWTFSPFVAFVHNRDGFMLFRSVAAFCASTV